MRLSGILFLQWIVIASIYAATIRVSPGTQQIGVGTQFSVTIHVDSVTGLHAASITVKFTKTLVQYIGIAQGGFFSSNGADVVFLPTPDPAPTHDSVKVDQAILGSGTAVNGSGTFFTLTFLALQQVGTSPITLVNVDFRDTSNAYMQVDVVGGEVVINSVNGVSEQFNVAKSTQLLQNYPNPFNSSTMFRAVLPAYSRALLTIVDLNGRIVRTITMIPDATGTATGRWDGTDEAGMSVVSGFYLARIVTQTTILSTKIMLLK